MQEGMNQGGEDICLHLIAKCGYKEEEHIHHQFCEIHDPQSKFSIVFMGRSMQHNLVFVKQESSQYLGGQNPRGGIHRGETRDRASQYFWLSSLHSHACGEEDKVGALL